MLRDFFIFIHLLILGVAYVTVKPTFKNKDDVLGRDQTEEWKGIMQVKMNIFYGGVHKRFYLNHAL